ncbi:MAG TPA: DUF1175 family protein [Terriglobales bacterium]
MPRWLAVVAVLAVAAVVCAFTVHHALAPQAFVLHLSEAALPADGFSSSELTIRSANGGTLRGVQVEVEGPHQVTLESLTVHADSASASLQSGVVPGETKIRVTAAGFRTQEVSLRTTPEYVDAVGDGTPDFLRLHDPADRVAFRRWFTLLAESQYYRGKPQPEIDDCAALLRFSYREAMREHDAAWAHAAALPAPASTGDIQQYRYPYTPLGADLFRVKSGSFTADDLRNGAFAEFANAETLWRFDTFSVGRALSRARPGDLLFFRQDGGHMPFHAMIYLGHSQVEPGSEQFVVYHTGPNGDSKGIIKRLSVAELLNYPDPRWRPVTSNPAFLGVYRWNILRGGE